MTFNSKRFVRTFQKRGQFKPASCFDDRLLSRAYLQDMICKNAEGSRIILLMDAVDSSGERYQQTWNLPAQVMPVIQQTFRCQANAEGACFFAVLSPSELDGQRL